tara:strand:- start:5217 stop:5513 length:297 start_codon:yes stop_codon:yes gene_type:complete
MKSYKVWQEGWFSKKSPEDEDEEELQRLGQKSAGRGGWDKKEQEKYNDLWMKLHKKGSKLTKTMTPPSVYGDDSWATKTIKLHKKLRLTTKDNPGVMS